MKKAKTKISAKEFDKKFDDGEDVIEHLDLSSVRRAGTKIQRVNIDMPKWMVERLDQEAKRLGITRQAVMKTIIARTLDEKKAV